MLKIQNLTKTFGNHHAVNGVNLTVTKGSFVGIIGRSGAGKSTLLRMINLLETPSCGEIFYADREVSALEGSELYAWRSSCAMVFQQFNLANRLDVLTNVLMGRLNTMSTLRSTLQWWTEEDKLLALKTLQQFGMAEFASKRCSQLSGGQQQRVAICRALVQNPEIILADEPIASLDPKNSADVMDALKRINQELGITILVNLHSLDIANKYCDRLVGLKAGQVVFDGMPNQLTDHFAQQLYGIDARESKDAPNLVSVQENQFLIA
jgi:phosphonate transport system ATP-binding protein